MPATYTSQLGLYNEALVLLGQRKLDDLSENRESRRRLDDAFRLDSSLNAYPYKAGAIMYCLEMVKPNFASEIAVLNSPTASTTIFSYKHTLPTDCVCVVKPYSDNKLDQPVSKSVIQNRLLYTDFSTIYLRYITENREFNEWDESFGMFVAAYLAKECAPRLAPDKVAEIDKVYGERLNACLQLEEMKVSSSQPTSVSSTLTNAWRKIYNDALLIMGLPELGGNNDDSNRRVKLARALETGIVENTLEDTSWQFAQKTVKLIYDSDIEPEFGHQYAHAKPNDLHRIDGLYADEMCRHAIKDYADEGGYYYCAYQTVYLVYISTDYLSNPDTWPSYFKRYVAAEMARSAAPSLRSEGADYENAVLVHQERSVEAKATDATSSPPRTIASGSWVNARFRGVNSRRRP